MGGGACSKSVIVRRRGRYEGHRLGCGRYFGHRPRQFLHRGDHADLDQILNNRRLYRRYLECLKGGRCTADGRRLRDVLPDALASGCSKCTDKQRRGAQKVIKFLRDNRPEDLATLQEIYDPWGKYSSKYVV